MSRSRPSVLLPLTLALACGDDGGEPTTTTTTTSPATSLPDATTSTTDAPASSTGPDTPTGTATTTSVDPTTTAATSSTTGSSTTDPITATDATTTGTTTTTTDPSTGTTDVSTTGEPACPDGTIVCDGDTAQICDGLGGFKSEQVCPVLCVDGKGCLACEPGSVSCDGANVLVCNDEGTATDVDETCDPLLGLACDQGAGGCAGACANLGLSYIGCDYWPTITQQNDAFIVAPNNEFAVAVANTSGQAASVTITRGPATIATVMVDPGSVQIVKLPWIDALTVGHGPSLLLANGAYRLRSSQPVTVYQYNPFNATATNDASLLLPVNTWTGNYLVAAWPTWGGSYPGFYAVTAREDGTTVTITPSKTGKLIQAGGGIAADGTGMVVMSAGAVLQVVSGASDVTGTIVHADKPIQVIGGHECTDVPLNVAACDHLEESMFPIETLAKEYVVVPPVQHPNNNFDKAQVVRVIAAEANTTLTFTPDQPVAKNLAAVGDFVEIPSTVAKFIVTADKKILVSQYMVGQDGGYGQSDPSMMLAVTPAQWRKSYLFHAATTWQANFVDIIAPKDAVVTLDGAAVGGWQPIGASNYQVTHVKLSNATGGNHTLSGDVGVGIGVNGVQQAGSYWYPGGLDLDVIPQ